MQIIERPKRTSRTGWQAELADAVTSVTELLRLLELEHLSESLAPNPDFKLKVPRAFVSKMHRGDRNDPLLRQVLPLAAENNSCGHQDPVNDLGAMKAPGVLHKYQGRILLITTGACAIHCRYCFRRHYPYADAHAGKHRWQQALSYLRSQRDIREVILSGGDPLVLDNDKLGHLLSALEPIPHLEWLRIHTRLPVVLPARINDELVALLQSTRFRTTIVIHANHANELMEQEARVLTRLADSGATLLNQSVLLAGVNDSAADLSALNRRLFDLGVLPYYLHMLDPVQGAMHFDVTARRALSIMEELKTSLPGYLVPRLVREIPGQASKTAIFTI